MMLYISPLWDEYTKIKTYARKIRFVYRPTTLWVCYRTVSDEAVFVIVATKPIDILQEIQKKNTSQVSYRIISATRIARVASRYEIEIIKERPRYHLFSVEVEKF